MFGFHSKHVHFQTFSLFQTKTLFIFRPLDCEDFLFMLCDMYNNVFDMYVTCKKKRFLLKVPFVHWRM